MKKLKLNKTTLRALNSHELSQVASAGTLTSKVDATDLCVTEGCQRTIKDSICGPTQDCPPDPTATRTATVVTKIDEILVFGG